MVAVKRALKISPQDPNVLLQKANIMRNENSFEQAKMVFIRLFSYDILV
jgi:hypothetical protein